ncbi:MAG: hypothetical protein O7A98_09685 [Acidobacteria bacterium]|nr:hypothetical protein [Acidobacteriota bacterium]
MLRYLTTIAVVAMFVVPLSAADDPGFEVPDLSCLPLENNAALTAAVAGVDGGDNVRLYFRRLNPVGSFYYVHMAASGGAKYWSTFPQPEDRQQTQLTDDWWEILQNRDWMNGHDRNWLESFLNDQDQEAAEYYVAVYDGTGAVRGRSETHLSPVWANDCYEPLTPKQLGLSENLTIGEVTVTQGDKEVFHWLCWGLVTRIDPQGILHPDEYCRACVVGMGFVPPLASVATGIVSGAIIEHKEEATERQP